MPRVSASNPQAIHEITNIFTECTMALDAMKIPQRDPWLIQYCLDRLDSESRVLWGRECKNEIPTLADFTKFLGQRCVDSKNASQASSKPSSVPQNNSRSAHNKLQKKQATALMASTTDSACKCCQESPHPLFKCPKFLDMSPGERFNTVKALSLCRNCFASHLTHTCTFRKCIKYQGRHNQLLHDHYASNSGHPSPASSSGTQASDKLGTNPKGSKDSSAIVGVCASRCEQIESPPRVFLATALLHILTSTGDTIPCRLILDGGAQVNIMTSDLHQRLNLSKHPTNLSISGVNESRCRARYFVHATIFSRTSESCFSFKCFILPKVSGNIPNWSVDTSSIRIPHDVELADPEWHLQKPVDLLLSGNHYWASWLEDTRELGPGLPILKETIFGHVVVGEHEPIPPPEVCNLNVSALDESLRKFWEVEGMSENQSLTDNQRAAEQHFIETHRRNSEGRFVVQLPFKEDPRVLGDSRPLAIR